MLAVGYSDIKCERYTNSGQTSSIQIIMSPLRIIEDVSAGGNKENIIFSGCSMYRACENAECVYSWVHKMGKTNV
jgi:hypothetical protein